jgi:hypothetical protein
MRFVFSILLILFIGGARAEEQNILSCKPIRLKGESTLLSTKKPLLMMIHNLSDADLWITHPVSEASANAGWSSRLQAGNWSALALDISSFELSCIESKPGHEQQVPCSGVISICRWPVTMPKKSPGTYWAGENMALAGLLGHLGTNGFTKLPTKSQ